VSRLLLAVSVGFVGSLIALVPASGAGPAADPAVTISANCGVYQFCFTPATITITDGETVTWSNQSGTEHIVSRCDPASCDGNGPGTGTGTDSGFTTGDVPTGGTFSHTFHGPGTYPYLCSIHGYAVMHGEVVVQAPTPPSTAPTSTAPTSTGVTVPSSTTAQSGATTSPATVAPAQLARTGRATNRALAVGVGALVLGLAAATQRRRARP